MARTIHSGDFISIKTSQFKEAIQELQIRPKGSTVEGLMRGTDGWKRRNTIRLFLSLNHEQTPVLEFSVQEGADMVTEGQIRLVKAPCRFGGSRYYFVCPITQKRCTVLRLLNGQFMSLDGVRLLTRRNIPYTCQTLSGFDRVRRQVKLAQWRAERQGIEIDDDRFYQKPKWMRWNTFSRLIDEIEETQAKEDYWILTHWGRRLGMSFAR